MDAIITAAAHILIERGYEGATTGRIAERAGVSIGSLYQYFPNKEALVAALIEGHANEIVRVIEAALDDPALATVADGIRALIKAGMVAHRIDPALHKILNEQVPRVGRLAKAMLGWTAPASQGLGNGMGAVECSHMSGLLVRSDDRWPRWGTRIGSQTWR